MDFRQTRDSHDEALLVGGIALAVSRLAKEELVCSHL